MFKGWPVKIPRFIAFCTAIIIISYIFVFAYNLPKWFPFNRENALEEWEEKIFQNKVLYTIRSQRGSGYLSAQSDRACSGLIYKIAFSPRKLPMISWKWKVLKFPLKNPLAGKGKAGGWIEKDDYAARVYVIFPSWYFLHTRSIEYVWDEFLPAGTILTSPYFSNIKLFVVESGKKSITQWVSEERNIYEDYKLAFGRYPASNVGAIALMTDTDNTLSTAEATYSNIKVGYKNDDKR